MINKARERSWELGRKEEKDNKERERKILSVRLFETHQVVNGSCGSPYCQWWCLCSGSQNMDREESGQHTQPGRV